uniref:Uncharacterized protein n=1 Tax=Anguilla anguilla TaxID=7936 RepID=A0A0E9SF29_ANGAN
MSSGMADPQLLKVCYSPLPHPSHFSAGRRAPTEREGGADTLVL